MRQFDGSGRTTIHGYTADGERVGTYDSYAPAGITYTLRNLDGKVLRIYKESGGVWTWVQDYVYRDGAHLATIDGTGTRHFHLDHLGSIRLITNSSGSQVALHTYLPFGQEATSTTQDAERIKFTGHERDLRDPSNTTDDLDYMHARSTNPNLGRFLSVDPRRDADPKSPQSWNLYAYVRNNPLTLTDPTGESPLLDWLRKLFSGQWVEDLLKQQVIERTKPQGEKTEEQKQEERQLLEAADLAQSNQGAIVGTGAAKVAEGAREGITDVAGPIVREGASAIAFAGAAKGAQAVRRLAGGLAEASTVLRQAERWLGPGYKEIAPGVFRSADGLRQFRMTARDLAGHGGRMGAHVNFEALAPNGRVIENTHVLLEGK
jgi:RHS repeat-associated protein